jgi:hypothetical protein
MKPTFGRTLLSKSRMQENMNETKLYVMKFTKFYLFEKTKLINNIIIMSTQNNLIIVIGRYSLNK